MNELVSNLLKDTDKREKFFNRILEKKTLDSIDIEASEYLKGYLNKIGSGEIPAWELGEFVKSIALDHIQSWIEDDEVIFKETQKTRIAMSDLRKDICLLKTIELTKEVTKDKMYEVRIIVDADVKLELINIILVKMKIVNKDEYMKSEEKELVIDKESLDKINRVGLENECKIGEGVAFEYKGIPIILDEATEKKETKIPTILVQYTNKYALTDDGGFDVEKFTYAQTNFINTFNASKEGELVYVTLPPWVKKVEYLR